MRKEQIPEKHDFFPKQCQTYTLIHLKLYLLFWCFILVMWIQTIKGKNSTYKEFLIGSRVIELLIGECMAESENQCIDNSLLVSLVSYLPVNPS